MAKDRRDCKGRPLPHNVYIIRAGDQVLVEAPTMIRRARELYDGQLEVPEVQGRPDGEAQDA